MTTEDKPSKPARPPADPREARLAQALRDNLRRRKSGGAGAAEEGPSKGEPDKPL